MSGNQASVSQHAVLHDTKAVERKDAGEDRGAWSSLRQGVWQGLSEEATLSHMGETEGVVQRAGRREQQGWRKQGRDREAAEKAGSEEERQGPRRSLRRGWEPQPARQGPPPTSGSASHRPCLSSLPVCSEAGVRSLE